MMSLKNRRLGVTHVINCSLEAAALHLFGVDFVLKFTLNLKKKQAQKVPPAYESKGVE